MIIRFSYWPICVISLLSLLIGASVLRIHYLDHSAGRVLPRTESGKWRYREVNTPQLWLQWSGKASGYESAATLPTLLKEEMESELARNKSRNDLRSYLAHYGIPHLMASTILVASSAFLFCHFVMQKQKVAAGLALTNVFVGIMAIVLAFTYSYIGSLGW